MSFGQKCKLLEPLNAHPLPEVLPAAIAVSVIVTVVEAIVIVVAIMAAVMSILILRLRRIAIVWRVIRCWPIVVVRPIVPRRWIVIASVVVGPLAVSVVATWVAIVWPYVDRGPSKAEAKTEIKSAAKVSVGLGICTDGQ